MGGPGDEDLSLAAGFVDDIEHAKIEVLARENGFRGVVHVDNEGCGTGVGRNQISGVDGISMDSRANSLGISLGFRGGFEKGACLDALVFIADVIRGREARHVVDTLGIFEEVRDPLNHVEIVEGEDIVQNEGDDQTLVIAKLVLHPIVIDSFRSVVRQKSIEAGIDA